MRPIFNTLCCKIPGTASKVYQNSVAVQLVLVIVLSLVILFPGAAFLPFYTQGEPREALVAQAMLETGNWILPERYDRTIATKPPMTHWLMAAVARVEGGLTEFVSRTPALVLSLIVLSMLFTLLRKRFSLIEANLAVIVLLGSALWYRSSITARVDMVLTGFMTVTLIVLYCWCENAKSRSVFPLAGSLALACAILSKGPVALILVAGILFTYLLLRGNSILEILRKLLILCLPAAGISSIWYLAAYMDAGEQFLSVVLHENLDRFTGTMIPGVQPHEHSFWYLVGTLITGLLPFSILPVFISWQKITFSNFRFDLKRIFRAIKNEDSFIQFSLCVLLVVFGFYAIPASKRAEYLLPAYPFIAALIAILIKRNFSELATPLYKWGYAIQIIITGLYLVFIVSGVVVLFDLFETFLPQSPNLLFFESEVERVLNFSLTSRLILLLPAVLAIFSLMFARRIGVVRLPLFSLANYFCLIVLMEVLIAPAVTGDLDSREFAGKVAREFPETTIYSNGKLYGLNFYLHRKLVELPEDLSALPDSFLMVADTFDSEVLTSRLSGSYFIHEEMRSRHFVKKPGHYLSLIELKKEKKNL